MINLSGLTLFLDNLEEGVLFLDASRHVLAINKAAAYMLGRRNDEVIDRLCPSLFQATKCARRCEQTGACSLMTKAHGEKFIQDIAVQRPEGDLVSLRMWAIRLPTDAGFAQYAVVLRDRTQEIQLEEAASERLALGGLVGHATAMQELFRQILRVAKSEANILITGESGTGKELVARALHDNSGRANGPYVRVHCAAFPENLLEGELFGHARGAFTGADTAREGRFEAADGGTLLLDEIGEVPLNAQVKLLRVLQEREIERLGENKPRKVDVRILAATHRDLLGMVRKGDFRADLYYRLRVLPVHVPALRDRREDIPLLAHTLLANLRSRHKGGEIYVSPETLDKLSSYDWPGNVRELSNALEYAYVHAENGVVLPSHLPPEVRESPKSVSRPVDDAAIAASTKFSRSYYRPTTNSEDGEMALLVRTLRESGGNKASTARKLGMSRTTLWKKLKQYGLDAPSGQ